jgi:hypothetical protein
VSRARRSDTWDVPGMDQAGAALAAPPHRQQNANWTKVDTERLERAI